MSDKDAKRIRRKLLASVSRAVELMDAMRNAKLTGQDTYLRFRDTFYLLIDGVRCENSSDEWHRVEVKDLLTRENKAEVQHKLGQKFMQLILNSALDDEHYSILQSVPEDEPNRVGLQLQRLKKMYESDSTLSKHMVMTEITAAHYGQFRESGRLPSEQMAKYMAKIQQLRTKLRLMNYTGLDDDYLIMQIKRDKTAYKEYNIKFTSSTASTIYCP
jgi:hypothetical protein